ncbi:tripartite motif-containing protein 45-like isoform X1 [Mercenaria mercenaria]|uniref:tripartite motif-containing protein 45-like isoform X1 n=1 Tax=Mercenaria mercenaria TaxID=6596 RepID=UPI00234EFE9E|nr:tripartite motif-containing protein 45-like isoform X1 [Mercenaria mercenaria]
MAVSGRRHTYGLGSEEYVEISCKPCKDDGKNTAANGWCQECDEHMCSICFKHHRKGKFCKDHVLLDHRYSDSAKTNTSAPDDDMEKCPEHRKELVKFYCQTHDQVGCGDCMILEHKTCQVKYISDKAKAFKDSKELRDVEKDVENCSIQIQECLSEIQTNKNATETVHAKFICDLEAFRDEIVKNINRLTADMRDQATDIKTKDASAIGQIEQEAFDIKTEISSMEETLQSHKNQPNRLFAATVLLRNKLKNTKQKIAEIKKKNRTEEYVFLRDSNIESAMVKSSAIGLIQHCPDKRQEIDTKNGDSKLIQMTMKPQVTSDIPNDQTCNISCHVNSKHLRTVTLKKRSGGFGFNITGGYDGAAVFVSRIIADLPAEESGRILQGDKIISINDVRTTKASHDDAVKLLKARDQTKLVLSYCIEEFNEFVKKHTKK